MNLTRHIEDPTDNYLLSKTPRSSYYSLNHTSQHSLSKLISPMTLNLWNPKPKSKEKIILNTSLANCFSKERPISIN